MILLSTPRVGQLDSLLLDHEIYSLLLSQLLNTLNEYNKSFVAKYSKEIKLALNTLLFKFTVWDKSNSYGFLLSNLRLVNGANGISPISKSQKIKYYLLFVLGEYLFDKLSGRILSMDEDEIKDEIKETKSSLLVLKLNLLKIMKPLTLNMLNLVKYLELANFVRFLVDGKYVSWKFYLLNITTKINSLSFEKVNKGNVNYEFQNRQIVWNTLIEFVLFLLPIMNKRYDTKSLKKLKDAWRNSKFVKFWDKYYTGNLQIDADNEKESPKSKPKFGHLDESKCAICVENKKENCTIVNAYVASCGHVYDYLCLLEKLESHSGNEKNIYKKIQNSDDFWKCLRCGKPVHWSKPFNDCDISKVVEADLSSSDSYDSD